MSAASRGAASRSGSVRAAVRGWVAAHERLIPQREAQRGADRAPEPLGLAVRRNDGCTYTTRVVE